MRPDKTILLLGLGNSMMRHDGIGVHVVNALDPWPGPQQDVRVRDGGTLVLSLLPEVESCDALIVVDAAMIGATPGSVKTFEGREMDAQLAGKRHSVHELALSDLMAAAEFLGARPERRALVGVQPENIDWGLEPTETVADAMPRILGAVRELVERWTR
jgi:hydrogenase maturation protease